MRVSLEFISTGSVEDIDFNLLKNFSMQDLLTAVAEKIERREDK
jgi:hypothetical protein